MIFKNQNEFSLYIESIKQEKSFDTYTETIEWYYENETDHEMSDIAKMLNAKIINTIQLEAESKGLLKSNTVRLF